MKQNLLIFGGAGLIGSKFISLFKDFYSINAPEIDDLDILEKDQLFRYIKNSSAEVIINYAAFTDVDRAEEEKDNKEGLVYRLNSLAVKNLCEICGETKKHFVHFSTDYVFNGEKAAGSYKEEDQQSPLSWYGQTKYFAEQFILESKVPSTIVRTSMPFSSHYDLKQDIVRFFLKQLKENHEIMAINDQMVTPAFVDDLANALNILIKEKETGIYHVVCNTHTTPFDLARIIAEKFGLNDSLIKPTSIVEYNKTRKAKRSKYGWLGVEKFEKRFGKGILHSVEQSIDIFKTQIV